MRTTKIRITSDLAKRQMCSAPVPDTFAERMGQEVEVFLPAVTEIPASVTDPCQSKVYWQVVTDEPGAWWLCEHAVDVD